MLDAFAAEQTARLEGVIRVLTGAEERADAAEAQVERLRANLEEWLVFHAQEGHADAQCDDWKLYDCLIAARTRALLAAPAVQVTHG